VSDHPNMAGRRISPRPIKRHGAYRHPNLGAAPNVAGTTRTTQLLVAAMALASAAAPTFNSWGSRAAVARRGPRRGPVAAAAASDASDASKVWTKSLSSWRVPSSMSTEHHQRRVVAAAAGSRGGDDDEAQGNPSSVSSLDALERLLSGSVDASRDEGDAAGAGAWAGDAGDAAGAGARASPGARADDPFADYEPTKDDIDATGSARPRGGGAGGGDNRTFEGKRVNSGAVRKQVARLRHSARLGSKFELKAPSEAELLV